MDPLRIAWILAVEGLEYDKTAVQWVGWIVVVATDPDRPVGIRVGDWHANLRFLREFRVRGGILEVVKIKATQDRD